MTLLLIYLFGALGMSFLCSVLEAVLLSTPSSFIRMKEAEGNKTAIQLQEYKNNIDRPVAAILSLNTVAHTIGAAGVGSESTKIFGEAYFGIISAVLTLLILIFSEIIPKTIGASYWRQLAMPCTGIIRVLIVVTWPLVWLSEFITRVFTPSCKQASVSREEINAMVKIGAAEGIFQEKESHILQSCMKLSQVKARDIMTPSVIVETVAESSTLKEAYDNLELLFTRIPVFAENKEYITGYILRTVMLEKLAEDDFTCKVADITRPILSFAEETSVYTIWEQFIEKKEHIATVVDEYGGLRGIITMEDVIETMLGVEIVDENDPATDMQQLAREKWERIRRKQLRALN